MRNWAVARKHVGTDKLPAAYSVGRYRKLNPQSRARSCKSLSFNLSLFLCRRESLILRICFRCRSFFTFTLWDEDVRLKILRENQLECLEKELSESSFSILSAIRRSRRQRGVYIWLVLFWHNNSYTMLKK
jgi:hypothetical protein